MEYYRINGVPHILANAAWGNDYNQAMWNSKKIPFSHFTEKDPQWADKFHTWRMDWNPQYMRIYLDDELLNDIPMSQTVNGNAGKGINPFTRPQYLLLNLALGGDNGGEIDDAAFLPKNYYHPPIQEKRLSTFFLESSRKPGYFFDVRNQQETDSEEDENEDGIIVPMPTKGAHISRTNHLVEHEEGIVGNEENHRVLANVAQHRDAGNVQTEQNA